MKKQSILHELRAFLVLWFGQSVSQLGSEMTAFALTVWMFQQRNTVTSSAMLSVCHMAPMVAVSLFIGPVVDRTDKKKLMLLADGLAAAVSLLVLALHLTGRLDARLLYGTNAVLGICSAIQSPASMVAISTLIPRKHDVRVSGLQSFSGALIAILSPSLAMAVLAFGGLQAVLITDLATFFCGLVTLLMSHIPTTPASAGQPSLLKEMRLGLAFLRGKAGVCQLILYQVLINLIAGFSYYTVLSPMILLRTGGNELVLGTVNSCIGIGAVLGALLVTLRPARGSLVRTMCAAYCMSFALCDLLLGVGRSPVTWYVAALLGNLPLPMGDGCLTALYRRNIPTSYQGRVFSLRNALVQLACILGNLLGAYLSDHWVVQWAGGNGFVARGIALVFGTGEGRLLGVLFGLSALVGSVASLSLWRSRSVRMLEETAQATGDG